MRILETITTGLFFSFFLQAQPLSVAAPEHVPGRLIVQHAGSASDSRAQQAFAQQSARVRSRLAGLNATVIEVAPGTEEAVRQTLLRNPLFRSVELDYYAHPAAVPNDQDYASQWYLGKIQAPTAWNLTSGSATPIAVVDSGVDGSHPDLAARLLPGWNFVSGNSNTSDTTGHGTAVTGVLGGIANNRIGVAGVTWLNPILPLVAVDATGYAAYSNIAAAIQYAADHGARVINVSLGGSQASPVLQSAVNYAWSKGAVVVAAAMNNSSSTPMYPAACANAIAVSATDENDNLATFSNYGNWITLAAPGNDMETTTAGGGYGEWYGTSLAAPVVSGVSALVLAVNPSLTAAQLVNLLEQNADDLGAAGYDNSFGWGRVNAYRAVSAASGGPVSTPAPPAAPASGSFSPIRLRAGGAAYVDSLGQTWAADWGFSSSPTCSVAANIVNTSDPALYRTCRWGDFNYSFAVPNGAYTVTLKFAELALWSPGQRQFNVAINGTQVLGNFDIVGAAGAAFTAVDQTFGVTVTNGQIAIQFSNGAANFPMLNALQIVQGSSSATPPAQAATQPTLRIHAGGPAYVDPSGQTWAADYGFSSSPTCNVLSAIAGTTMGPLYQTCRWGDFTYTLPVANGNYEVTLKFAEVAFLLRGSRQFNVSINGAPVLSNFDIVAAAGAPFTAIDRTFPVTVTGGQITIQFTNGASDFPMVNAIQIAPQ